MMMMKSVVCQFWWRKPEYPEPEETTDLRQVKGVIHATIIRRNRVFSAKICRGSYSRDVYHTLHITVVCDESSGQKKSSSATGTARFFK